MGGHAAPGPRARLEGARVRVLVSATERPTVRRRDALAILSRDLVADGCGRRESGRWEVTWCRPHQNSVVVARFGSLP